MAEIRKTLLAEGASEEDVTVILGSVGEGPQVQPDPTQKPLALAQRVFENRTLRIVVGVGGVAAVAGLAWAVWVGVRVVWALIEGFTRGR